MRVLLPLLGLLTASLAELVRHDASFVPDIVLEATEQEIDIDCKKRLSVVFNGTSPGPTLRLSEGKTTWIRVYNRIEDQNLTVHWHGLSQRTAPFSDGTPLVAQWPIPGGHFFDYEVRPLKGDAGTYFYHSHVGFQQVTAHGALIVKDPAKPPYQYDQERLLTVGTFFDQTDEVIVSKLLNDPLIWPGEVNAVMINGKSGTAYNGTGSCKPHVIEVEPGKKYRLRVIGASALPIVNAVIQNHRDLEVIQADGTYVKNVKTSHIQVAPGQRFSYILQAKTVAQLKKLNSTNFWIRYETRDRPVVTSGYALLKYKMPKDADSQPVPTSFPLISPVAVPNITYDYLEGKLQGLSAVENKDFPKLSEVTRTVIINATLTLATGAWTDGEPAGVADWALNSKVWQEDHQSLINRTPYLISVLRDNKAPNYRLALKNNGYDPSSQTYPARIGEVIDIVWQADGGIGKFYDSHPMHMHGEPYWDLGSGNGSYDARAVEKARVKAGTVPAKRDTTMLYRYVDAVGSQTNYTMGWRAWRVRVTEKNVGAWMAHCHIAAHAVQGMSTIWVFGGPKELRNRFPTTPYISGYLNYGGSAYGSNTKVPVVNHYFNSTTDA
ncbi:Iron transport multicopper oxidase [Sphaceloma murrayae]|uniref:Iron transport multicopper oxidase n=1 Tax=Sphaceloma murrayae TaxID=2082308 RepID=A0A2K1R1K0_9PEZI|nr:Iron transport multicopper oxidase [Sphaceloma murrayae]